MMQINHCENCGNAEIALEEYCVEVNFTKASWCEKCNQSTKTGSHYLFCSEVCFLEYIRKVVKGERKFEPKKS